MIKDLIEITCPCCGQRIEVFIEAGGKVATRFYDIETDSDIVQLLADCHIELGNVCRKEDE